MKHKSFCIHLILIAIHLLIGLAGWNNDDLFYDIYKETLPDLGISTVSVLDSYFTSPNLSDMTISNLYQPIQGEFSNNNPVFKWDSRTGLRNIYWRLLKMKILRA